jgi:[ribosomal protein S5]-alanine N-acetyltransferase
VAPVVVPGSLGGRAQPVLYVDELTLRPWTVGDVPSLVAAYADPAIQRWHTRSMTLTEADEWVTAVNGSWTNETAANWAVSEGGELVGRMSLRTLDLEDGLAGIGYWVVSAARGRGIAPRTLVAVSDWAINELGLHRLELEHSTRNEASCRVAEKAGYSLESTKRSQALHEDGWHDMHLHVRLDD